MLEANTASKFFAFFAICNFPWYKKSDLKKSKRELLRLGPYRVTKVHSHQSYQLTDVNTQKTRDAYYVVMTTVNSELAEVLSEGKGRRRGRGSILC